MKQVVYVLKDVNMGMGHIGLSRIADTYLKRYRLAGRDLQNPNNFMLFINSRWNKAKLYQPHGEFLLYIRKESGRLRFDTVQAAPVWLGGQAFVFPKDIFEEVKRVLYSAPQKSRPLVAARAAKAAGVESRL